MRANWPIKRQQNLGKSSVSRQYRALSEALLGRKSHANPRGVRLSTVLWQNRMNHSATALLLRSADFKASYLLCHEFHISKVSDSSLYLF